MSNIHQIFVEALHAQQKLEVTFIASSDNRQRTRTCAPLDYGPLKRANDYQLRYHFWDYADGSTSRPHPVALLHKQIIMIVNIATLFDPAEFITWDLRKHPWHTKRNWGHYS